MNKDLFAKAIDGNEFGKRKKWKKFSNQWKQILWEGVVLWKISHIHLKFKSISLIYICSRRQSLISPRKWECFFLLGGWESALCANTIKLMHHHDTHKFFPQERLETDLFQDIVVEVFHITKGCKNANTNFHISLVRRQWQHTFAEILRNITSIK